MTNSPAPAQRGRPKLFSSMSIRNRIALYYTGATALLIAIVFAAIIFTVDSVVYRHLDEELLKEAVETLGEAHIRIDDFGGFVRGDAHVDDDVVDHDDDRGRRHHHGRHRDLDVEFVQLSDAEGRIVRKSASLFENSLGVERGSREAVMRNSTVGGATVRQLQLPLLGRDDKINGYLVVAVPLRGAMLVLRDLSTIILVSFPVIIILLFVVTRLIAGQSIRPIDEVIATAETITQSNLDQRIALPRNRDELYRMSVTVNALLDRLQQAFGREKQFTADAAHELKTPLAAVKGTLEVLVRKPREVEHYESRVRTCLTELNRMARLIDQLLMLARYDKESGTLAITEVDLARPVNAVMERLQPVGAAKGIAVTLHDSRPGTVAADPALLEIMLGNLLSNAIKYSPEGSPVEIRILRRDGAVVCAIEDHGIGIPAEQLPAIFDRFYRVDESRSAGTGGSGLGLSIVKKLADLQSIAVSVTSEPGQGSTFELTFPS
ncbi:HAMP domain-containing protein [Chlorobaculum sp. 24CR]|uniref:sensor histidine kinase n=1 Tax=Chlorobaculum sp. 24CR TaxID=2508878 RepID=UPI00100B3BB6|nr:ATP-binding protein [Chlorobaculum sp. 24CR]RXK88402.1 HAMP domain-containing protein [Chlorobaculum sp. 24CR]